MAARRCQAEWTDGRGQGKPECRIEEGLPRLPDFEILLLTAKRPLQPVTDALAAHIEESFALEGRHAVAAE